MKKDGRSSVRRAAIIILLLGNAALLIASVIYARLTAEAISAGSEMIPCYFKDTFKLYCPGCGSSRALVALFRLDFLRAVIFSPGLVTLLLIVIYADLLLLMTAVKNDASYILSFRFSAVVILIVAIVLSFVLKNLLLYGFGIDLIGDISGGGYFY